MHLWLGFLWVSMLHFVQSSISEFQKIVARCWHLNNKTVLGCKACWVKQVHQGCKHNNGNKQELLTCGLGLVKRHWLAILMLCLIHRGEAGNPGPQNGTAPVWTLGTFNPSGLNGKQQILAEHLAFGDVWAVTETHLSSRAAHSFKKGLKSTNNPFSYCVCGNPTPQRPQSEHAGAWTGVCNS